MKKILLIGLLGLAFCNFKANFSQFNDNSGFIFDSGAKYELVNENSEFSLFANDRNVNNLHNLSLGGSFDYLPNETYSPFIFVLYNDNQIVNRDTFNTGIGIAWLINDNILKFPYRNKLSYAFVKDNKKESLIHSLRWKFKGYINKVGVEFTMFHLGYMHSFDSKITYKLDNNINLLDKFYFEDYLSRQYCANSIGIEIQI